MIRRQQRRKVAPWPCAGAWVVAPWQTRRWAERMMRDAGPFAPTRAGRRVPRLPTTRRHRYGPPGWVTRRGWEALMHKMWGFHDE
jgi:hypothetical protein